MEHISKTLEAYRNGTLDLKNWPDGLTPEAEKESQRRSLNIMSLNNTFENFKAVEGTKKSLATFQELLTKPDWFMLLVYGKAGCGKTHLCEAFSIELAKKGIRCPVFEWSELVRDFKKLMRSDIKDAYDARFEMMRRLERLIIDDVGQGSVGSNWEWGELEDIVNYRYRNNLMTIVTTNLDIKALPPRIISRFRDAVKSRMVVIDAGDYRPLKKEN
uniref:Putative IstB domain protein ATP-binding protein n=1 Tax=viral metagenome TaxID=1070528 RepID=A0A6M3KN36_9ZZZZ